MSSDPAVKKWHKRLLKIWAFIVFPICAISLPLGGIILVLELNLAISVYTVLVQHYLGQRQEEE